MTTLADRYLNQFQDQRAITLVGPMAKYAVQVSEPVIFVDGGSMRRESAFGITVGDGDSSTATMDIDLDPVKDFSDLSFALGLLPERITTLSLLGFLGGRRDHELFNLGEVHHFLSRRQHATRAQFDEDVVAFSAGQWTFSVTTTFSLSVFGPATVCLSGACAYPIARGTQVKPVSSYGLSNEGHGEVQLECDAPVFIFLN